MAALRDSWSSVWAGVGGCVIPTHFKSYFWKMSRLIIEGGRSEREYWHDLWRYRELFYFLAWRDLLVRYKQTFVGVAWSLLRPLLTVLVLTVVFGRFGKMRSDGTPYPLLVLCGMLPWQFFSSALAESGSSLVSNSNLISKVYFPRLVIPASSVITSFVDFLITAVFLVMLMIWYRVLLPPQVALFPVFVLLAFAASFGAGLWIAALMVKYRDFRFIVPFIVQFGLYISPVGFVSKVVREEALQKAFTAAGELTAPGSFATILRCWDSKTCPCYRQTPASRIILA